VLVEGVVAHAAAARHTLARRSVLERVMAVPFSEALSRASNLIPGRARLLTQVKEHAQKKKPPGFRPGVLEGEADEEIEPPNDCILSDVAPRIYERSHTPRDDNCA